MARGSAAPDHPVPERETIRAPEPVPAEAAAGTVIQSPAEAAVAASWSETGEGGPPPALPGYELIRVIGRGGMGVVYHARDTRLNRPAAVKMVLGGGHADPTAHVRFLIEAEAVAALQHPHVVQVYEFGRHAGLPYFAMEYLPGGTLADRLRRDGRLGPREAAGLVAALAGGVAAAHAKGVIHRDLKPGNILLAADGSPKVADFGLARLGRSDLTGTGAVMGTPGYMSPEQAAGRTREVGTAADVYALGAVLYHLLTGRPPFEGVAELVVFAQAHAEPPRPRSGSSKVPPPNVVDRPDRAPQETARRAAEPAPPTRASRYSRIVACIAPIEPV